MLRSRDAGGEQSGERFLVFDIGKSFLNEF